MTMAIRWRVLGPVLLILSLPGVLAISEAASFHRANRSNGTLVSSGERREYLLHVPASYDPGTPTALVISLHGAALWPVAQQRISQWDDEADRHGFLVVYPSGVAGRGPRTWRADGDADQARDVRFIAELIDTLSALYRIDSTRIYANGLSNGGGMSFVLSCTLADRIAAVGMVAAAHLVPWSACTDRRPVPMVAFHGTKDTAVPYEGGLSWVAPIRFPGIPAWTATWADRNHCAEGPIESRVAADVTRIEYRDCAADADVVLYRIAGGGHTWPGGGPLPEWFVGRTSPGVDATAEMWTFFRDHPLVSR